MLRSNLPRAIRHLRRRRRWRQRDLADASGVSRQVISRIERGESLGTLKLRNLDRVVSALDASMDVNVRWRGEELDRLLDAAHAQIQQSIVKRLEERGWATRVEVSFNHYGDRGRVDVLGWHSLERILLVVEAKSAIGDINETLGRMDVKLRLGSALASNAGWPPPRLVVPALVIGDSRRSRRVIAQHDSLMRRFSLRRAPGACLGSAAIRARPRRTSVVRHRAGFPCSGHYAEQPRPKRPVRRVKPARRESGRFAR